MRTYTLSPALPDMHHLLLISVMSAYLFSLVWQLRIIRYKRRVSSKPLFISGPKDFHVNQGLHIPCSTETMECYMVNNKAQALIKYPIHNSITRLCWHHQLKGTLMNTQISPNLKCTSQHPPHRGLLFVKCAKQISCSTQLQEFYN